MFMKANKGGRFMLTSQVPNLNHYPVNPHDERFFGFGMLPFVGGLAVGALATGGFGPRPVPMQQFVPVPQPFPVQTFVPMPGPAPMAPMPFNQSTFVSPTAGQVGNQFVIR